MRKIILKKKRKTKKKFTATFIAGFLLFLSFFVITSGFLIWYRSRAIPEVNEAYEVTSLPSVMRSVLGAKANHITPELSLRVPIFIYHYVEYVHNDPGRQNLNVPPNVLTAQIETLKNDGYTFITPSDLVAGLARKKKLPKKIVMLTFDDGYMDFYTDVYPVLQKEHVKAAEYVVPNFLDRPNYMFTLQLKEVAKSPLVEIGAHTMDHLSLSGVSKAQATYEIIQSRKVLQNMLGLPINSFAYPYGSFDQQAVQIVKDAGFTNAVSTVPGIIQSPAVQYFLYRLHPEYRMGQVLLDFLKQNAFQTW